MIEPILEAGYRYSDAEARGHQLDALLKARGITVRMGGALEQAILSVNDVVYRQTMGKGSQNELDALDTFSQLIGLNELATLLVAVSDHPDFSQLLPHLRLLNEGAALQNTRSSQSDSATNKIFELFAATLAMQLGTGVRLDDPVRSDGRNPDVLATIGARRWGIACKVLHSRNAEGLIQHLEKGISQIEISEADIGVVFVNLKNVIDREAVWPTPQSSDTSESLERVAFVNFADPYRILLNQVQLLGRDLMQYLPRGYLSQALAGKKAVAGVLFWAHATSGVLINGQPTPSSVRVMNFQRALDVTSEAQAVLEAFNWAAFPDSPSRGPRPAL